MIDKKNEKLRELADIGKLLSYVNSGRKSSMEMFPFFISSLIFPFGASLISTCYEHFVNESTIVSLVIYLISLLLAFFVYFIAKNLVKGRDSIVSKLFLKLYNYEPVDNENFIAMQHDIRNCVENNREINYKKILEWRLHEIRLLKREPNEKNNVDKFLSKKL